MLRLDNAGHDGQLPVKLSMVPVRLDCPSEEERYFVYFSIYLSIYILIYIFVFVVVSLDILIFLYFYLSSVYSISTNGTYLTL